VRFRFDRLSGSLVRRATARFLRIAAPFVLTYFPHPAFSIESAQPGLEKLFHLAGIPGLRRDERVNLSLTPDGLLFETKKVHYQVPYVQIHQILVLQADRRYEGRTYAAAVATYGIGSLLILKKHHVDTVVLDYVNERGGKMGIVVQMEVSQGEHFKDLLKGRNLPLVEPGEISEALPKPGTGTDVTDRSKP